MKHGCAKAKQKVIYCFSNAVRFIVSLIPSLHFVRFLNQKQYSNSKNFKLRMAEKQKKISISGTHQKKDDESSWYCQ